MSGADGAGNGRSSVPIHSTLSGLLIGILEAQAELILQLRQAAEFRRGKTGAPIDRQVGAASAQLHAIVRFLQKLPSFSGEAAYDLAPLIQLYTAMLDLPHGIVAPILEPARRRSGNSASHEIAKGIAARAMSELMHSGLDAADAATAVASCFPDEDMGRL